MKLMRVLCGAGAAAVLLVLSVARLASASGTVKTTYGYDGAGNLTSVTNGCSDSSQTYCTGQCFSLATDPANCGACGKTCPGTTNGAPACSNGACTFSCNSGFNYCSASGCVSLSSDTKNCGTCGRICSASNGTAWCSSGQCGVTCYSGYTLCSGSACVSLTSSNSNCGACGHACASGYQCTNGTCVYKSTTKCAAGCINCGDGICACNGRTCP